MAVTASSGRTGDFTEPHRCAGCKLTFWAKASWNFVTVICPRCKHRN